MKISATRYAIDEILDTYRNTLDTIADEEFDLTPPDGGWSYAEIYSHILQATIGSTIAAERCANGTCEPTKEGLTWTGRLALTFGYLPKVTTPPAESAKIVVKKITKEDARNLLIKCRGRIDTIAPRLKDAPPAMRYKHSRLGMLNAQQWFKFTLIHLRHHLKQIERLKNKFKLS
jgi:hypothetical protein